MTTRTEQSLAGTAPDGAAPAAATRGLNKTYGTGDTRVHALKDVDASFEAGKFTAIMGPSGSGQVHPDALPGRAGHRRLGQIWIGGTESPGSTTRS